MVRTPKRCKEGRGFPFRQGHKSLNFSFIVRCSWQHLLHIALSSLPFLHLVSFYQLLLFFWGWTSSKGWDILNHFVSVCDFELLWRMLHLGSVARADSRQYCFLWRANGDNVAEIRLEQVSLKCCRLFWTVNIKIKFVNLILLSNFYFCDFGFFTFKRTSHQACQTR